MFDENSFLKELRQVILVEMKSIIDKHEVDSRVPMLADVYRVIHFISEEKAEASI